MITLFALAVGSALAVLLAVLIVLHLYDRPAHRRDVMARRSLVFALIEAGHVRVDGALRREPAFRIDPDRAQRPAPMTSSIRMAFCRLIFIRTKDLPRLVTSSLPTTWRPANGIRGPRVNI